jgi:hypothetical protein
MILYTTVPMEVIFPPSRGRNEAPFGEGSSLVRQDAPFEVVRGEMRLILEPAGPATARVLRMISPRPSDYLDPKFLPGSLLRIPW